MENPTLAEGSDFGTITEANAQTDAQVATPEGQDAAVIPATDGGTTEPEVPAAFKEQPSETADKPDKPDLAIDPELEGHPILKAKWEAYVAQKEKGINKWMTEKGAELRELQERQASVAPILEWFQDFENPETVDEAFAESCISLAKTYGKPFGGWTWENGQPVFNGGQGQAQVQTNSNADPESKYGFEYASEDKVADVILGQVKAMLNEHLGPVTQQLTPLTKHFETAQQRESMASKAAEAVVELKQKFEVSADPYITKEMVSEAMSEFPSLTPEQAFKAHFALDIAKYYAKHARGTTGNGNGQPRNLPANLGGGQTTRANLAPGADFGTILAAEATL